ncbi:MAG: 50S ribosomal protein L30 [Methanobacteriota archaeon]|nr:MAG: 50S ribosomal protein L30 [Euryarchaeota archaeon]
MSAVAVVRVRGHAKIRRDAVETMEMLRLTRPNHCVLLPHNATTKGMLQVVKDYVTWGEVNKETIANLLKERGEVSGGAKLTDSYVKGNSSFASVSQLAQAIEKAEARMTDVRGLKPVMRLHPPRQGYSKVKRPYSVGGAVGYRGAEIERLLQRMLKDSEEA